jgi:Lrp/AsnC family transcriptional regulator, leucine-responsive regulatory protein
MRLYCYPAIIQEINNLFSFFAEKKSSHYRKITSLPETVRPMDLDDTDRRLLALLQQNAHLTMHELGQRVNLSKTPVHERIKRLERAGVIARYVAVLDKTRIGSRLQVYCQITLDKQNRDTFALFETAVSDLPAVLDCSRVSGTFDYLLKIIVPDMDSYNRFYQDALSVIPGIVHISSFFVLVEVKNTTAVPV